MILIIKEKIRPIMIGMIPASFILIGGIAYVLKTFAILPTNPVTQWSVHIGAVFMLIFFSIAIADRINTMRKELALFAGHLEVKVEERTAELKSAIEALTATNVMLTETRNALWGEMELAKKLQTVLLPKGPAIPGYHITAHMKPAAEVGGDYYDIINEEGRDWLVIGDVSGHGVPAGLIMMMAQTAIRTAIRMNPDLPPSRLLSVINGILTGNIKRLDENRYMTITVFRIS
jgi:serine phosphatase RsbU (regulator of sigma subunit)